MFCGTQQVLSDSIMTKHHGLVETDEGPLFGTYSGFTRIKNNCSGGYEAYFVL